MEQVLKTPIASTPVAHRFKKGQSGNPRGSSRRSRQLAKISHLNIAAVAERGSKLLTGTMAGLLKVSEDPQGGVLDVWLAKLILRSMETGDAGILRGILDRVVGKAPEHITVSGPQGGPVQACVMTRDEKIAELERLRKIRLECGDD